MYAKLSRLFHTKCSAAYIVDVPDDGRNVDRE